MAPAALRLLASLLPAAAAGVVQGAIFGRALSGTEPLEEGASALVGTTGLAPYPGYDGGLQTTGDVYFAHYGEDDETWTSIHFHLWDTDPNCTAGVSQHLRRAPGSCSVAVHSGASCDDIGGLYAFRRPWIPYATVNGSALRWHSVDYASLSTLGGRTVVVRDAGGAPVACAPLRLMQVRSRPYIVAGEWQAYPGYDGDLRAEVDPDFSIGEVVVGSATGQLIVFGVKRADPACSAGGGSAGVANSCGLHVHEGTSCADADAIGGHLFNESAVLGGVDPWASARYVIGRGGLSAVVLTGLALSEVSGRVLVAHDAAGARIACAALRFHNGTAP